MGQPETEKCLNHFFPPKEIVKLPGDGDCKTCVPHSDNHFCKGYQPVKITIKVFEVKDGFSEVKSS